MAAAFRGEVEQSLRAISCPDHKPAAASRTPSRQLYQQGQGSSLGNQHYLLWKFGEYNIPIANGTLLQTPR